MTKARKNKVHHRETLLNYLGDPANEFPTRAFMNDTILDFNLAELLMKENGYD